MSDSRRLTIAGIALVAISGALAGYGSGPAIAAAALALLLIALPAIRLRRRGVKWLVVVVTAVISWTIGAYAVSSVAEHRAREFCDRFPRGSAFAAAVAAAAEAGEPRLRRVTATEVWVGYVGVTLFDRHFCVIESEDGHVSKASYAYLD